MPNYCNYEMKVKGLEESVDSFIETIQADYTYDEDGHCNVPRHFWRVFQADVENEECKVNRKGEKTKTVQIYGDCAWSVYSCMFDGPHTYQSSNEGYDSGTTVVAESERLGLKIEIYSSEPGMCFQEHYIIDNGELILEEECQYYEYTPSCFDTVEEYNKQMGTSLTQAAFDTLLEEDELIVVGGFGNWDYNYIDKED